MVDKKDIPGIAFGLFAIALSLIVSIFYISGLDRYIGFIMGVPTSSYTLFSFAPSSVFIISVFAISIVFIFLSIFSIIPVKKTVSPSFNSELQPKYFRYLAIFIFVQLMLSFLMTSIYPSFGVSIVDSYPLQVQDFYYIVSSFFETVIFQFIPLTLMILLYGIVLKKPFIKNFLNFNEIPTNFVAAFSIIGATAVSIFYAYTGENVYYVVSIYVSMVISNIIYLKFGFFRALLSTFILNMTSFYGFILSKIQILSLIFLIVLFIWSTIGIFYMFNESGERRKNIEKTAENENRNENPQKHEQTYRSPLLSADSLWIRSTCPECGGIIFHVKDNMYLECDHCHHILSPDDTGPFNVKIDVTGRPHMETYQDYGNNGI
ncbi:MAG: hypothetical protein ACP5UV_06970 [Thermoplasmata archaeon]